MDKLNRPCKSDKCSGVYIETCIQDDWDGTLHCSECKDCVRRHGSMDLDKLEAGIDILSNADLDNVSEEFLHVLEAAKNWALVMRMPPGTSLTHEDHDESCLDGDVDSETYLEPICGHECDKQWTLSDRHGCESGSSPDFVLKNE